MAGPSLAPTQLAEFRTDFRTWLESRRPELAELLDAPPDFDDRVASARKLRGLLWDDDWGRYGWPAAVGGLGGSVLHRAVVYEELVAEGWHGPTLFEHLEIIAPTIVHYARPDYAAQVMPAFLDGSRAWAQAFSETEAGSDLAALRTRAVPDGNFFVVTGTKIWTSWAKWAHTCLALVRTGALEERHRGLTMLCIDLDQPGVTVRPIRQANGTDELAEVSFQEVRVPATQLVGRVGNGWEVTLYLLARERGVLSWFRHCHLRARLTEASATAADDRAVGELVVQLAGLRAAAASLVVADADGAVLGPTAAYAKLLMTRLEQRLYDTLRDVAGARIALPSADPADVMLQRDYLFSRIVTIYGGSQQMQLRTVSNHLLGLSQAGR